MADTIDLTEVEALALGALAEQFRSAWVSLPELTRSGVGLGEVPPADVLVVRTPGAGIRPMPHAAGCAVVCGYELNGRIAHPIDPRTETVHNLGPEAVPGDALVLVAGGPAVWVTVGGSITDIIVTGGPMVRSALEHQKLVSERWLAEARAEKWGGPGLYRVRFGYRVAPVHLTEFDGALDLVSGPHGSDDEARLWDRFGDPEQLRGFLGWKGELEALERAVAEDESRYSTTADRTEKLRLERVINRYREKLARHVKAGEVYATLPN